MKFAARLAFASIATTLLVAPSFAFAEKDKEETKVAKAADPADDTVEQKGTIGRGSPSEALPPPRSDNDPYPPAAAPKGPAAGVIHQAGAGGSTAYGRAGVLELGGAAYFASATDFTQLTVNPSIGWFFMDNVQLSAILGLSHLSAGDANTTFVSFLIEPSLHLPFSDTTFGFVGAGIGPSWIDGPGLGLAFAPRIGLNMAVGRSGILTPSVYVQYSTHDAISTPSGAYLAVSTSYGAGIGYTVMW